MNQKTFRCATAALVTCALWLPTQAAAQQLAHMVFFKLKESTPQARENLVAACNKYLSGHEGVLYYSAGVIAQDLNRPVNVRDFDVALHVVFANKAAHDRYQTSPRHVNFVEENSGLWEPPRVFDSYIVPLPEQRDAPDHARRLPLPDAASHFAGMVGGEVVAQRDDRQIVLRVQKVAQVWSHSQAKDPQSLVGKLVLVSANQAEGKPIESIQRFMAGLKVGSEVTIDVAHRQGETLTMMELTDQQR